MTDISGFFDGEIKAGDRIVGNLTVDSSVTFEVLGRLPSYRLAENAPDHFCLKRKAPVPWTKKG